ncbi:HAD family hydrolase [Mobilicoccus caccae]|uniref:Hydrolase n=1 Tax=Mobilicoccus caccae TaxID=1859295 RepID=A0ABQ6ITY3_9MICO|nr:HAD family hydrolase [Mobilicoccus caccae]GMA41390.1 hydrolase [Mobilicoccus caccae]
MIPAADRPRLVATDLDGTLLDPAGEVTPFTRDVLQRVWDRGIETLFVTARPPRWLDDLADAVGGHGHAICANGAFLYDVAAREVVHADLIGLEDVVALAADLRREIPRIGFALEHAAGMHLEHEYGPVNPAFVPAVATYGALEETGLDGVGKLLARIPGGDVLEGPGPAGENTETLAFLARVQDIVGDRAVVSYSGAVGLAEIGPVGVSKASALATWCDRHGIDAAQVWAFGDMPNDIPMLEWAGRSFAVQGAPESVLAAASDVCGPNDADGVARALLPLLT